MLHFILGVSVGVVVAFVVFAVLYAVRTNDRDDFSCSKEIEEHSKMKEGCTFDE